MNEVFITTSQNVTLQYNIAALDDRVWAHVIDIVLMAAYTAIVWGVLSAMSIKMSDGYLELTYLLTFLPVIFYHLLFELFDNGQSPGKHARNIKVVKLDGSQLTVGALLIRWIFRLIDFDILWGAVALIVIAVNGKGQRLGDIVAGTAVVKTSTPLTDNILRFTVATDGNYVPAFPQIIAVKEKQMLTIRQAFIQALNSKNTELIEKTADTISELSSIKRPEDKTARQFIESVIKDYYYYQNRT